MSIEEAAPFMIEAPRAAVALDRPELEHLAYHGHSEVVFDHLLHLPEAERRRLHSPGILSAAILGGIEKLRRRWQSRQESPRRELELIERTVADFDSWSEAERRGPREPFLAMLAWSDQLRSMARDPEGLAGYDRLEALGIRRYPDLHGQLLLGRARGLLRLGRVAEAHEVLLALAGRPYLHPDRNAIAEAVFLLGQTALLTGRAIEYHRLLLRGLRMFSTDFGTRRLCVRQLVVARRGFLKALTDPALTAVDRGLFLAHYIESALARSKPLAALGLHALARFSVLAGLYLLNYAVWDGRSARLLDRGLDSTDRPGGNGTAARRVRVRRGILVTRAMGGIGDFLMMTPGLHALRERHPGQEIHLAIPRAFFPVFEANPDVSLMDIENGALDLHAYRRWFNLTDCPAARIESRSVPNVRADRIEIFARALGIRGAGLRRMDRRPRYSLTEAERQLQREFWRGRDLEGRTVIGVQAHAAESYRDYPRMEELVAALAREAAVLVFGQRGLEGFVGGGIVKVADLPLRRCFALAAACDVIVAPDSAFVHFAGACALPCVALYGPIDGRLRTRAYPACTALDAREALRCVPCWRNERIPCKLTGRRESACMENIPVNAVLAAVRTRLSAGAAVRR